MRLLTNGIVGFVLVASAAWGAGSLCGQESFFQDGNTLYRDGDFSGAIAAYESVLAGGFESPELYYNLGNGYYRAGQMGRAVLNYERVLRRDPGHADAAENLRFARSRLVDRIDPLPGFWLGRLADWWIRVLPSSALWILSGLVYLATACGVVYLISVPARRSFGPLPGVVVLCGFLVLGLGLTHMLRGVRLGKDLAIVMVQEVAVLSAPSDEGGLTVFQVHEGTRLHIAERTGDWLEVILDDGKVGWLRADFVEEV